MLSLIYFLTICINSYYIVTYPPIHEAIPHARRSESLSMSDLSAGLIIPYSPRSLNPNVPRYNPPPMVNPRYSPIQKRLSLLAQANFLPSTIFLPFAVEGLCRGLTVSRIRTRQMKRTVWT